jgi:hypothetical protein
MKPPHSLSIIRWIWRAVGLLSLAPAAIGSAVTFSGPTVSTSAVQNGTIYLNADKITNATNGGLSGTLRMELWAFTAPFTSIFTSASGQRLAVASLGQLPGNSSFNNLAQSAAYTAASPANGIWYNTMLLTEYVGNSTADDGFVTRDFRSFNSTAAPVAPVIVNQPVGQTVPTGSAAVFTAVASSNASVSFQWFKNGVAIPGATSSTQWSQNGTALNGASFSSYTIAVARTSDAAAYSVVATVSGRAVSSNAAALMVTTTAGGPAVILSLSSSSPGSSLAITGSGFSTTAATTVTFTDAAGNVFPIPADNVSAGEVDVTVPPYINPATFTGGSATVRVAVVQQTANTTTTFSAVGTFTIGAMPVTGVAPGAITVAFLQQEQAFLASAYNQWNAIQGYSAKINAASLLTQIAAAQTQLASEIALVQQLQSGAVSQLPVGQYLGNSVYLDSSGLALMDQVILSYMFNGNAFSLAKLAPSQGLKLSPQAFATNWLAMMQTNYTNLVQDPLNVANIIAVGEDMRSAAGAAVALGTVTAALVSGVGEVGVAGAVIAAGAELGMATFTGTTLGTYGAGLTVSAMSAAIMGGGTQQGDLDLLSDFMADSAYDLAAQEGVSAIIGYSPSLSGFPNLGSVAEQVAGAIEPMVTANGYFDRTVPGSLANQLDSALGAIEGLAVLQPKRTVNVLATGLGSGTITLSPPDGVYSPGTSVTATAAPTAGSTFDGWSGAVAGSSAAQQLVVAAGGNPVVLGAFTPAASSIAAPVQNPSAPAALPGTWTGTWQAVVINFGGTDYFNLTWNLTPNGTQYGGTYSWIVTRVDGAFTAYNVGDTSSGTLNSGVLSGNSFTIYTDGGSQFTATVSGSTMTGTGGTSLINGPFTLTKQ